MDKLTCVGCKTIIQGKEFMTCQNCKHKYDLPCANISPKRFKKISQESKLRWKCLECKSRQPKLDNTNTPVRAGQLSTEDEDECSSQDQYVTKRRYPPVEKYITESTFKEFLSKELKKEIETVVEATLTRLVSNQLKDIVQQFSGFQSSMTFISEQYEELKNVWSSTSLELKSLKEENKALKENLTTLCARVKVLEDENMKQQQWVRLQNVEITGIPENKQEDAVAIVQKLCEHIGVSVAPTDVEFAHRVQPRREASAARARPIIARFRHRVLKDKIIVAARKHRDLNTRDMRIGGESSKIYINEHLTKDNKMLLKLCKQKGKELNYKFIWTKNCRIFVRKNETSPPIPINSSIDVGKIV